jgi:hypothetical protein
MKQRLSELQGWYATPLPSLYYLFGTWGCFAYAGVLDTGHGVNRAEDTWNTGQWSTLGATLGIPRVSRYGRRCLV